MSRKTITVDESVYDRVDEVKRDEESWSDCLLRLVNTLESGDCDQSEHTDVLTESHIDDIVARTARQTATEVENRLTGR